MIDLAIALPAALFAAYCALLAAAAAYDVCTFTIPNRVSLGLAGLFFVAAPLSPIQEPWLSHIGAGVAILAAGMVLFSFARLGGGDVKLMSAVALWTGFEHLPAFLFYVSIAGGVLALLLLLIRRLLQGRPGNRDAAAWLPLPRVLSTGESIPYALAIAPAGILVGIRLPGIGWPWP